ncbi:phosphatidate cytidylyltransferase [Fastidiosibacter lacustris]|uniref:phosphatidate cytidylyltransferase n=1 Tax=Fastidiosibacter lacustris TaxID=2056695 RepID=UPI000E357577|nr:phosphatidate cytidylyltransferase [Fastidiosibacter lacustris]
MKERIITGVILGLIVLGAIFCLSNTIFDIAVAVVLLFAAWEWTALANIKKITTKIIYLAISLVLIYLSRYSQLTVLLISLLFWFFACYLVLRYPNIPFKAISPGARYAMGFLVIVPMWISLSLLHQQKPALLLLMMLVVTLADSGAYFVGRQYGKKKLAPIISPKKTVEGFVGGFVFGGLAGVICALVISHSHFEQTILIILSFAIVIVALLGDLFESMIKRECGVKDSGTILPGHGGILDRMDSLFSSFPIFVLMLIIFGLLGVDSM